MRGFVLHGYGAGEPDIATCACTLNVSVDGHGRHAIMDNVCAYPSGEGIGTSLLQFVEMVCIDHLISRVTCFVVNDVYDTPEILHFYKKNGFVDKGVDGYRIRLTRDFPISLKAA